MQCSWTNGFYRVYKTLIVSHVSYIGQGKLRKFSFFLLTVANIVEYFFRYLTAGFYEKDDTIPLLLAMQVLVSGRLIVNFSAFCQSTTFLLLLRHRMEVPILLNLEFHSQIQQQMDQLFSMQMLLLYQMVLLVRKCVLKF